MLGLPYHSQSFNWRCNLIQPLSMTNTFLFLSDSTQLFAVAAIEWRRICHCIFWKVRFFANILEYKAIFVKAITKSRASASTAIVHATFLHTPPRLLPMRKIHFASQGYQVSFVEMFFFSDFHFFKYCLVILLVSSSRQVPEGLVSLSSNLNAVCHSLSVGGLFIADRITGPRLHQPGPAPN